MRNIVTAHQGCSRCDELLGQLYLIASESGIITAKLSEGRWPFRHWAKITRKGKGNS